MNRQFLSTVVVFSLAIQAANPRIPLENGMRILFLGDSITDKNGPLDRNLKAILKHVDPGMSITTRFIGVPDAWFRDYVNVESYGVRNAIATGNYDFVICQPYQDSYAPKGGWNVEEFYRYADTLNRWTTNAGGEMIIWSIHGYNSDDRDDYLPLSSANCAEAARRAGCRYIQTVEAWDSVYRATGSRFLWGDIIHQSASGSALYAMVMYSYLMNGASTVGLGDWEQIPNTGFEDCTQWTPPSPIQYQSLMEQAAQHFARQSLGIPVATHDDPVLRDVLRVTPVTHTSDAYQWTLDGRVKPVNPGNFASKVLVSRSGMLVSGSWSLER